MNYSKAIRTIRASQGLSQENLAGLTGLNPSYISRIENSERQPTIESLEIISEKLNVPFYLLTLLASEKKDIGKLPLKETRKAADQLFNILLSAQLQKRENVSKK